MKKIIVICITLLIGIIYGVLIGKYGVFPYQHIKKIQDKYENITESKKINNGLVEVNINKLIALKGGPDSTRIRAIKNIFGTNVLPNELPNSVEQIDDSKYKFIANLNFIEKFHIKQDHSINSEGYIFHPKNSNSNLIIYHQGHSGDFYNGKNTVEFFVNKGYTVYALNMPLTINNNNPTININKVGPIKMANHKALLYLDNPLSFLIKPVITMVNYAETKNFKSISMCGLSGGGWTTIIASAIDTRISKSIAVAASYPLFLKLQYPKKSIGDWEEYAADLYKKVNYLELYALASIGENRKQFQVYNEFDPCCYDGNSIKPYKDQIEEVINKYNTSQFEIIIDSDNKEHSISISTLQKIETQI